MFRSRQMGGPTQSQMGGGFGGSQPQLRQPALQSPYSGRGGGMQLPGMGAFQNFMRQQQMGQQYQNSRPDLTGGPMGAPQQSGGLFGALSPQQNPGGFGNQQQSQLQQALQSFRGQQQMGQQAPQMPMIGPGGSSRDFYTRQMPQMPQQQMFQQQMPQQPAYGGFGNGIGINIAQPPQSGIQAMPQQDMLNAQQQALAQTQQMPMMPQPQMPMTQPMPQMPMTQPMPQMNPMRQAVQSGIRNGQFSPRALSRADMMGRLGGMTTVNSGAPTPQAPAAMLGAPQTDPRFRDGGAVTEDPRMQAMRGIQQLANRQRGYNR